MPRIDNPRLLKVLDALPTEGYITDGLKLINAPAAWADTKGKGTIAAVLDTGCDRRHPDLAANVIGGESFIKGETWDEDFHGHGTHVAGIIAANGQLLGVAPETKLWIGKVLNRNGYGSDFTIARAIYRAVQLRRRGNPIVAINLSLGGPSPNWFLRQAIRRAVSSGILIVCAGGNDGDADSNTDEVSYPAFFPESVAVGAVDIHRRTANFSSSNREIDVAGPGVDIYSTFPGGKWAWLSGTSMATPHVSGFAALLAAKFKLRTGRLPTEPELYAMVKLLTVDVAEAGIDTETGAGLISFLPSPGLSAAAQSAGPFSTSQFSSKG